MSLLITFTLIIFYERLGASGRKPIKRHWVVRARVASLQSSGLLFLVYVIVMLGLAFFWPNSFVLRWGCSKVLEDSLTMCLLICLVMTVTRPFVPLPRRDQCPEFDSDDSSYNFP